MTATVYALIVNQLDYDARKDDAEDATLCNEPTAIYITRDAAIAAARKDLIRDMGPRGKIVVLEVLLEWADSEEGRDYRADHAAGGFRSPVTAKDVLAVLEADHALALEIFPELADSQFGDE